MLSNAIEILNKNKLPFALEKIINLVISKYSMLWIALLYYDQGEFYPWQVIGEKKQQENSTVHEKILYYMGSPIGKLSSPRPFSDIDNNIFELISFVFFQTVRENSVNFKLSRLHMLSEISKNANEYFDISNGMERVIEIVRQFLEFDIALLYRFSPSENMLILEKSFGDKKNKIEISKKVRPGDSPLWKVAMAKKPGLFYHKNIKSYIAVPLASGDNLLGVLAIGSKRSYAYTEQDIISINIITSQIANIHNLINSLAIVKSKTDDIIESMPYGLLTIDINQRINGFNKTATSYFKRLSSSFIGQHIDTLGDSKLLSALKKSLESGTYSENIEIYEKDLYYEISCFPFKDDSGKTLGAAATFKDISELKRLKTELDVKKRLSMIGEMATSMAHEIRNPLSGIRMLVQLLQKEFEEEPERQEYTSVILEEVDRLESFVSGVLEYSRPAAFKKTEFSIKELFENTVLLMRPLLDRNGINVEMNFKDFMINADFDKLKHIFINLIKNSANAMKKSHGTLMLSAIDDGKNITLTIKDDGCGIPDDINKKIFEPFYTTTEKGNGLGLPLVKRLVDDHNGKIIIDSIPNIGTTFSIVLPHNHVL